MSTHYTEINPDPHASGIVESFGRGGGFAVDEVCPTVPVEGKYFRYFTWTFADMVSQHHKTRIPDEGPANVRKHRGITSATATCEAHGLKEKWTDADRAEAEKVGMAADHEMAIWEDMVHELKMVQEAELKTALDAATNTTTLSGTQQWNNASAAILPTITAAKIAFRHQFGANPTHMIIPEDCWAAFIDDSTVIDTLKYTHSDLLADENGGMPPKIRGVQPVIPTALTNSANPGATASIAEIWSDDKVYFLHVNPRIATMRKTATAAWFGAAPSLPGSANTWWARSWRPADEDCLWTWYATMMNWQLITCDAAIYRMDDVLA